MPYPLNTFDKSWKAARTTKDGITSKAVKTSCVLAKSWCILQSLGRKPDWLPLQKQFYI